MKALALLISLAASYGCFAQSCKTDLASILYVMNFSRAVGSQKAVSHLEKHYSETIIKCMKSMNKEVLYKANKDHALAKKEQAIKEAYDYIAGNYASLGNGLLESVVPDWEAVIKELEKREAQK